MSSSNKLFQAASGVGGAGEFIDDLFATTLYDGNQTANTITTGIDLDTEGGLLWIKVRTTSGNHIMLDTARGSNYYLSSNTTTGSTNGSFSQTFTTTGFTLNTSSALVNDGNQRYVAWNFRKAPGFFDVVTYTGDGNAGKTINHNLGSVPGMIFVKQTNFSRDWGVWHTSTGATKYFNLNKSNTAATATEYWNDTEPTATQFTVGTSNRVNGSGSSYIAYIFGNNDQIFGDNGNEAVVKCGKYTGTGSAAFIDLGFEPQWVMVKQATVSAESWYCADIMRIMDNPYDNGSRTKFEQDAADHRSTMVALPTATGFFTGSQVRDSGSEYIYMAIRRPMKTPESASTHFDITQAQSTSDGAPPWFPSTFPVDLVIWKTLDATNTPQLNYRIGNQQTLVPMNTTVQSANSGADMDYQNGWYDNDGADSDRFSYNFRRGSGFFDVMVYDGDGTSSRSLPHNLTVAPEVIIHKCRSAATEWELHFNIAGYNYKRAYFTNAAAASNATFPYGGYAAAPTADNIFVSDAGGNQINGSSQQYLVQLFASLDGISKVGIYVGTGSSLNVDCGFSSGAKFVLIKRLDDTGDWYVFDTDQGLSSSYWLLNSSAAKVTANYLSTLSSGFTVNNVADVNTSSGEYFFIAIAQRQLWNTECVQAAN